MNFISALQSLFLLFTPINTAEVTPEPTGFSVEVYPYGGYYSYPPCPPGYRYGYQYGSGPYCYYYGGGDYYYYGPDYYYGPGYRYYGWGRGGHGHRGHGGHRGGGHRGGGGHGGHRGGGGRH